MKGRSDRRVQRVDLDPRVQAELEAMDDRMSDTERRLRALEERVNTIRTAEAEEEEAS